jgi:Domain of unknown function (DUF4407)
LFSWEIEKMLKRVNTLLEFLSGVDPQILQRPECRGERRIYQGIGLTIGITGFFACISASYAMYSIFKVVEIAIALGLFWGFTIAMIDRFLIMTTSKQDTFSWKQVSIATSRILMATLIAIVVSKPLEMAIFNKEIGAAIAETNLIAEVQMQQTVAKLPEAVEIDRLRQENKALQAQDAQISDSYQKAYDRMIGEAEGTSGSNKAGKGPVFDEKFQELQRQKTILDAAVAQHQTQIQANNTQSQRLEKIKATKAKQVNSARLAADSILAQMQMLHKMAVKDSTVTWASYLISGIFVAIDVLPLLGKLMMNRTAYDAIVHHQTIATIKRQAALTENLGHEIQQDMYRHNQVQDHISQLTDRALIDALAAIPKSREWQRTQADAVQGLVQRASGELLKAIGSIRFPKSIFRRAARKAMQQEIPDLARKQAQSKIFRQRIHNATEDIAAEAERAVNEFIRKDD